MKALISSCIVVLLVVPLIFTACKNDDDPISPPAEESIFLLTKVVLGQSLKEEFKYDEDNRLLQHITHWSSTEYTTESFQINPMGLIGSKDVYSNVGGSPEYTSINYVYDQNKKLIKSINYKMINGLSQQTSFTEYEYGSNGVLQKRKVYSPDGVLSQMCENQCDGNNNVKKEFSSEVNADGDLILKSVCVFDYDDKINPYRYCRMPDKSCPYINKNNILKAEKTVYTEDNPGGIITITEIVYQYNQKGYPTSRIEGADNYTYEYKELKN